MPNNESNHLLAIETGILGGSICYFKGKTAVDRLIGKSDTSRAEELISGIQSLLSANDLHISQIDTVAISRGPGSYTGLRIGLASAQGLATALACTVVGVPLLEAINTSFEAGRTRIVILPFGKNEFTWQAFDPSEDRSRNDAGSAINYLDDLPEVLTRHDGYEVVCHSSMLDRVRELSAKAIGLSDCLAEYVGSFGVATANSEHPNLSPIYSFNSAKKTSLF